MNSPPVIARVLPGVLVATVIMGVIVFAGMRLAGGEPPDPATPTTEIIQLPSDAPTPPAIPNEPVLQSWVNIEGKQVKLPQDMTYALLAVSHPREGWPPNVWFIEYRASPTDPAESWLATDTSGFIIGMEIRPEHEARFKPFLDAASTVPTQTPLPLVKIGGRELPLPPGMEYHQIIWSNVAPGPNDLAWVVTYVDSTGVSRLYIDDDSSGTVLKEDIRHEHRSRFDSLLD